MSAVLKAININRRHALHFPGIVVVIRNNRVITIENIINENVSLNLGSALVCALSQV